MGLPKAEIPLALLLFNVGVEIGQMFFVAVILLLERSFRTLAIRWPRCAEALPGYAVGLLGAFWTIQRTAILLSGCAMTEARADPSGLPRPPVLALAMSPACAHIACRARQRFLPGCAPISGLDHVLAMVAVGLWGAQLGRPRSGSFP